MKKIVSFFFFTLVSLALWAQNIYPVQVQPTVISSSIFLQDYADQSNFRVKVSLTDITKQNFQIRLKMTLTNTAKSIVIKSNQGITLTLDGGQVYFLSDQDLAALFSPTDLTGFTGNTLQEGAYLISFEATSIFDETVKVSNKAMDFAQTIILQNDPPLLNQPLNNAIVDNTQITNALYFTWMPRSFFTSPNRQVKYALRLVKINNVNDNPYQAITNDAYIIKSIDNVLSPTFILDPSDVRLEGGTLYAWQVQAYEDVFDATQNKFVPSGARFKNNGFSEVFTFTTKDDCPTITCLPVVNTTDKVTLTWDIDATTSLTIPNTYEIQYREQGTTLPWTIVQQSTTTLSLDKTQIQEGLTYEYKVAALCKTWQPAVYGGTFKLQKPACIAPDPIRIDNQASGIILTWDEPTGQTTTNYPATYTQQGGTETKSVLTNKTIILPKITSGGYNVKIDAQCDALLAEGKTQFIAYNDNGFVGPCPIPSPFKFIATRIPSTPNAKLAFTNSTLHKTYKLEYWSNATPTKIITLTSANNVAEFTADSILDNQLYSYRVTFICDGGKQTTAPVGMFKISPATTADPGISPGTANCFPPAQKSAEARSKSSAKFDWSKVTDADEYLLLYRKKGSTGNFTTFATTASDARINRLDSTIYEYKIKCRCGTAYSIDSEIGEVDLSKPTNNSKCDTLAYVNVSKTTTSEVQLAWKYDTTRTGYTIFYKEKSQAWADQYTIDLQANSEIITKNLVGDTLIRYSIINLKSGTDYQFKVQGVCGVDRAQTNDIDNAFTTIVKGDCESGKSCDRNLRTPITSLTKADTIQIADYKISIDSITAVAGTSPTLYKGFGLAEAPFVGYNEHIRINIKFDSLLVNTKGCVLDGDVDFISIKTYILDEATRKKIEETMAKTKELVKKGTEIYNTVSSISGQLSDGANQLNNYFQGGGDVGKVKTGDLAFDAEIDGVPTASNYPNRPALVKDKTTGTVYQIDQNGNVNTVGKYDDNYKDLQTQNIEALNGKPFNFAKNPTAIYDYNAFDKTLYTKPIVQTHYLKFGTTYVDAKLTVPKVLDKVNFAFSGDKSKLKFVNRKGFVFNYDGTSTTLNLIGGPASDAQEIMAVYDDGTTKKVIGGLLLASYAPKQKKVILVRTNLNSSFTNTAPQIQTELNKIFGKIGVNYTVTIDESFKDNNTWRTYGPTEFKLGGNTALKNEYTDDAKSMQDKYLEHQGANIDTSAVYLFLVSNPTDEANSNENLDGKMNIGKPFGFLIINQGLTLDRFTKTLAHELCHGQYLMFHVFDNDYLGSSQLNSANLMAYGSGSELIKFQWDIIHDTGVNWGIGVSDKNQQAKKADYSSLINDYQSDFEGWYMSPSGKPFYLPKGHKIAATVRCGPVIAFEVQENGQMVFYNSVFSQGVFQGYSNGIANYNIELQTFNYTTNDINVIRDFVEITQNDVKVRVPVVATINHNRMKILDPDNLNSNNIISYQVSTSASNTSSWKPLAINKYNISKPYAFENKYYRLPTQMYSLCLDVGSTESNKFSFALKGQFNHKNVDYYSIPKLDGVNNYQGIVSEVYLQKVKGTTTTSVQSKLYVTYGGKDYNSNQLIYIPEASKIVNSDKFVFELKGNTKSDVQFSFNGNLQTKNLNPITITNRNIYKNIYDLTAVSDVDQYNTTILGCDLYLSYLNNSANTSYIDGTISLPVSPDYNITIGAGDNVYFDYITTIPFLIPENAKNETDVKFYLQNVDGTSNTLLGNAGYGTSGTFKTTTGILQGITSVQYKYLIINLIKKADNEILVTKKIKIKVVPKETITNIRVTDKTALVTSNPDCNEYDKEKGRFAENGEILYIIANSDCEDENTQKKFDFEVKTSANNTSNVPVEWVFYNQKFKDITSYSSSSAKEFDKTNSNKYGMSISESFNTQSSLLKGYFETNSFSIKFGPLDLSIDKDQSKFLTKHNVGNLTLKAKANIFGDEKTANVVFVNDARDELTFELSQLNIDANTKPFKIIDKLNKITKFAPFIQNKLKSIPLLNKTTPAFKIEAGFLKPTYKHYLIEKPNSRLYQSVHEIEILYGDASISYEKKLDFTSYMPAPVNAAIKIINYGASWVGSNAELKVGCDFNFKFGVDAGVTTKLRFDQGDGNLTTTPYESYEFSGKFKLEILGKPNVSFNFDEYSSSISGELKTGAEPTITYNPETGEANWKIETSPMTFTPQITIENLKSNKVYFDQPVEFELFGKVLWYDSSQ